MSKPRRIRHLIKSFIESDASNGMVLILAAVVAMVLANSASTAQGYQALLETPVQIRFGELDISKNLLLWINDALMALFFLLIGLEVKRELISGELASRDRAVFPVIAALGEWRRLPSCFYCLITVMRSPAMAGPFPPRRISLLRWACWPCWAAVSRRP